jgi:hypothetical protein
VARVTKKCGCGGQFTVDGQPFGLNVRYSGRCTKGHEVRGETSFEGWVAFARDEQEQTTTATGAATSDRRMAAMCEED